jgi:hypothetical protein
VYANIFNGPNGTNQGDSGLVNILVPPFLSSNTGSLKVISGTVTEIGWGTIMHEHVSSNTQWDSIQQRWQSVLQKMSIAY